MDEVFVYVRVPMYAELQTSDYLRCQVDLVLCRWYLTKAFLYYLLNSFIEIIFETFSDCRPD